MAEEYYIRSTTVFADATRPMMKMNTRYGYLSGYEKFFKERVRFRLYFIILGLLGIYLIFANPLLAAAVLAGAMYFYQLYAHRGFVIGSQRRILQAM